MESSCDLQVDVNGEQTFFIHKKVISSYCGKIRKLFKGERTNLKVIFHDFPGGPETFELISIFCYNNGKININPYTAPRLFCAAHYLEMDETVSGSHNLLDQTKEFFNEIRFWSWPELLLALKNSRDLLVIATSSEILQICLDSLVARIVFTSETSPSCPSSSSPDSSGLRLSTDSKSTESLRSGFLKSTWWFEDLIGILTPHLLKQFVKSTVFYKFDHGVTVRFLIYYQKSRFVLATKDEKREIIETVIDSLCLLDHNSVSCKSLFGILRVSLNLNINKMFKNSLVSMIGSQLDQATLDNLLIPSPPGSSYLYDVDLVLQFVKYFLKEKGEPKVHVSELKNVARLLDSYITEVAPDPRLKPYMFLALMKSLPDSARDSYVEIYHAIDIYLRVHSGLSGEEKTSIFNSLNYEKLSTESCNHLAQNNKFLSRFATTASKAQQLKLENLFHDMDGQKRFILPGREHIETETKEERLEQYAEHGAKLDIVNENEKMRAHLEGMQWRVVELEKACKKMQTQMTKIMKSKLSRQTSAKSLPRFCS